MELNRLPLGVGGNTKEIIVSAHPGCDECEYRINTAKDAARAIGSANRAKYDHDAPRSVFMPTVRIIDRGD
ncbi:MAG: hypothetical protein Q7R84_03315 [bacterium]|nr:hypothetical protein [bacterium]